MKLWKEPLDPDRHVDHFGVGSATPRKRVHGREQAYFVQVAGFTFELASIDQLGVALEWFATPIHPSSREPVFEHEKGEWQPWHSRLPAFIKKSSKRERVIEALRRALEAFR